MTTEPLRLRAPLFAFLLAAGTLAAGGVAADPSPDTSQLARRVQADEARVAALQGDAAAARAHLVQVADLFGPSDEEKAAAAAAVQREQNQDSNIAGLNQRASDLEDSIRHLTGQIEELNHRLDQIDQRIDRLRKEFDYKLCQATAQQLGAAQPGDDNALPCAPAAATTTVSPTSAPTPPSTSAPSQPDNGVLGSGPSTETSPPTGVTHLAPPPGVLGTLPQSAALPPAPLAPTVPDTKAQFDAALHLLAMSQYDQASGAFRSFADSYPKDPLAPQALYWLGDIAYVQKDYRGAAQAFLEELKKYPTSARGAESMLKLGQSLIAMNQKSEGCAALHALPGRFPSASKTVLAQAEALRKAGGCRH